MIYWILAVCTLVVIRCLHVYARRCLDAEQERRREFAALARKIMEHDDITADRLDFVGYVIEKAGDPAFFNTLRRALRDEETYSGDIEDSAAAIDVMIRDLVAELISLTLLSRPFAMIPLAVRIISRFGPASRRNRMLRARIYSRKNYKPGKLAPA